jgi:transcriptional regulator with XRE-family HTH domain
MGWDRAGNLPERLVDLRHALGLTQAQFGDVAGVSDQTVSDWENGRSRPARATLTRLAKQLGIPVVVFQQGGEMPSTLLKRLAETRTAVGGVSGRSPGRRAEDKALAKAAEIANRLAFLRDQLRSYDHLGLPLDLDTVRRLLDLTADKLDATPPDPGTPGQNGSGSPPPAP